MPRLARWPEAFPIGGWTLPAIIVASLLAGVLGHDPWKTDDAIHIAIAHGFGIGHWLVPELAGEAWLESPPLFDWLAAITGWLLSTNSGLFPWHDAARLATPIFIALGLAGLTIGSRRLQGEDAAKIAPLLALGTLGLLVPAHDAQPAVTGFVAVSILLAAFAEWHARPRAAGISLGAALGLAFLGGGLDFLLPTLVIAFAVAVHPHWRNANRAGWLVAITLGAALIAAWPLALAARSPPMFTMWWTGELADLGGTDTLLRVRLESLAWGSWPAFPLALWTLWLDRRRVWQAQTYLPLVAMLVTLAHFLHAREPVTAILPLLAPLIMLASSGAGRLRRGAANAFDWFGAMTLTLFMALIWLGGIAILTGLPERVAKNFSKPAPGFIPDWSWPALIAAVVVTLAWIRLLAVAPKSPWRAASRWSLGVGAVWLLLVCLWLPWIDYGKSYRPVSADFRGSLGGNPGCIERHGLGPAQRASLDYFDGIRTVASGDAKCNYRIVQTNPHVPTAVPGWKLIKISARPGDRGESLRLYRRAK